MGLMNSIFGGLADGRPGPLSQLDGSSPFERVMMRITGTPVAGDDPATRRGMIGSTAPKVSSIPEAPGYEKLGWLTPSWRGSVGGQAYTPRPIARAPDLRGAIRWD